VWRTHQCCHWTESNQLLWFLQLSF
jgi:hypothetical protein